MAGTTQELIVQNPQAASQIEAATELLSPRSGDFSVAMLDRILGPGWQHYSTSFGGPALELEKAGLFYDQAMVSKYIFAEMLQAFNVVALAALTIMFVVIMATGVLGTAHEGEPLGKRYSTLWTPVRGSLAVAMLAPLPWGMGYSLLQTLLMTTIYFGIGGANVINDVAQEHFKHNQGMIFEAPAETNGNEIILSSLKSAVAMSTYAREQANGTDGTITTAYKSRWAEPPGFWRSVGSALTDGNKFTSNGNTTDWVSHKPGDVPCNIGDRPPGFCEILYVVPDKLAGLERVPVDAFGSAKIECDEPSTLLCDKRLESWAQVQKDAFAVANALTQPISKENPLQAERGYLDIMRRNFEIGLSTVAVTRLRELNSKRSQEIDSIADAIKEMGWISLGAYYLKVSLVTEDTLDELNDLVRTAQFGPNVFVIQGALMGPEDLKSNLRQLDYQMASSARASEFDFYQKIDSYGNATRQNYTELGETGDFSSYMEKLGLISPIRAALVGYTNVLTSGDPASNLASVGHGMLNTVLVGFGAIYVAQTAGKAAEKASFGLLDVFQLGNLWNGPWSFLLIAVLLPLLITGMMLAFYLPAVPFILWTFAVLGWLKLVIEVLVAAPLWAIGHGMPEGEGFAGPSAKQGYMLFLRVLVRPALMVVGFYAAMILFNTLGGFIGDGFMMVADSNSTFMGLFAAVGYVVILTIICVLTTHKIYNLITWLPDNILNWIAQLHTNLGEEQSEGETRNMVVGAVSRGQNAAQGATYNMGQAGKGEDNPKLNPGKSGDNNAHVDVAAGRKGQWGGSDEKGVDKEGKGREG